MAEIQQFNLGQLLSDAETIKGQRRQNQLGELLQPLRLQEAQLGLQQAQLGQTQQLARTALGILGDAPEQNWQQAIDFARQRGADLTGLEQYSPQAYAAVQQLAAGNQQGQRGFSFGGSQLVRQNGQTGYLVPRYNQASGQIETVFAPAGENFDVLGSGGVSAEQKARLDIETAEQKARGEARVKEETAATQELQKVLGKEAGQLYSTYQKAAQDASAFIPRLESLRDLAGKVQTGTGAEIKLAAKKALGVDSADMEELNAKLGELAQDILNQQTGTKTDFDFQNAVRQSAALGKTPEANIRLINALIERQQQAVRFGDMATQAIQERGPQGLLQMRYQPPQQQAAPAQSAPAQAAPAGPASGSVRMRFNPATGRLEPSQ